MKYPFKTATAEIPEMMNSEIADLKDGETCRAILNYKVIETTKNFVIFKITGFSLLRSKRII